MRRFTGVLLALVLSTACSSGGDPSPPPRTSALTLGTPSKLDETLASLRGKPTVVNYWATWCGPCKNEMPRIVDAAKRFEGRVNFLGVDVEDDSASAIDFIRRYEVPFRSLADPDGKIRRAQRLVGLPETHFYTADGELAFAHKGEIEAEELEQKISDVLAASRQAAPKGQPRFDSRWSSRAISRRKMSRSSCSRSSAVSASSSSCFSGTSIRNSDATR